MNRASLLLLLLLGCGPSERSAGAAGEHAITSTPTAEGAGPSAAPVGLLVVAQPQANGDVQIAVDARANETVRLRQNVVVERLEGATWTDAHVEGVSLRGTCDAAPTECAILTRGGGLRPPPWNGRTRNAQCSRTADGQPVPAGSYRMVVMTCDGAHRVESAAFAVAR